MGISPDIILFSMPSQFQQSSVAAILKSLTVAVSNEVPPKAAGKPTKPWHRSLPDIIGFMNIWAFRTSQSAKTTYFIGKTTYSNRKFDIIDPNKLLFNTYFEYVILYIEYWILYVKYVILYHTYSILTSKHQPVTFSEKPPSSLGCYSWEIYSFFRTCHFPLFSVEPLYQNVCIDHKIISTAS